MNELLLIRHAETEWSLTGRHTGRTDVPLTDAGRAAASALEPLLAARTFAAVLCSPLSRARDTAALAGLGERASLRDDLLEWDYGAYNGLTTDEIRRDRPDWNMWRDGCPDGERAADVGARVDRVIAEARAKEGEVAVVAHGHVLRVLAARWIDLDPSQGALLALATGALCTLGYERETAVIVSWNQTPARQPAPPQGSPAHQPGTVRGTAPRSGVVR